MQQEDLFAPSLSTSGFECDFYDPAEVDRALAGRNKFDKSSSATVYLQRLRSCPQTLLRPAPPPIEALNELERDFEHAKAVFDVLRKHLVLSHLLPGAPFTSPHLLLLGPPGVGKSYLVRRIEEALFSGFWEFSLAHSTASFALGGLDEQYSGGGPGWLVKQAIDAAAIREATEALNEGMQGTDMDRVRGAANKLAELFRQISLQLDQDRHALLELAEEAKSADASMPIAQRYRRVLEAYDQYVEPMNQMMDTGPQGTFYRYLEDAERSLDLALEQLSVQGGLYSHRLQLRQVAHQAKELRRFGRLIAQQCADTLLPLREEMRQHNDLTSAISLLLGQVRKRGLRRALSHHTADTAMPVWRNERGFRLQLGDEVRAVMAAARQYEPQSVAFPQDEPSDAPPLLEQVNESAIRAHLQHSLPVDNLLDWLTSHHGHLQDATLLRLFHELQHEGNWHIEASDQPEKTTLQTIRVLHHPHRVRLRE